MQFEDYCPNVLKTQLVPTFLYILLEFCDTTKTYDFNTRSFIDGQDELKINMFKTFNKSVSHHIKKKLYTF